MAGKQTVGELIDELGQHDRSLPVVLVVRGYAGMGLHASNVGDYTATGFDNKFVKVSAQVELPIRIPCGESEDR